MELTMWFEPVGTSRLSTWNLAENVFLQPWRRTLFAISSLRQRIARPSGRVQVSPVSAAWLREQGTEAPKRGGDS
jgi:hypothetical protein